MEKNKYLYLQINQMKCLNDRLKKETNLIDRLTVPQIYIASDISDFLNNRQTIKPTKWINADFFDNRYRFNQTLKKGAIVLFENINSRYLSKETKLGLMDSTGQLEINVSMITKVESIERNVFDSIYQPELSREKIDYIRLVYYPKKASVRLFNVGKRLPKKYYDHLGKKVVEFEKILNKEKY